MQKQYYAIKFYASKIFEGKEEYYNNYSKAF